MCKIQICTANLLFQAQNIEISSVVKEIPQKSPVTCDASSLAGLGLRILWRNRFGVRMAEISAQPQIKRVKIPFSC